MVTFTCIGAQGGCFEVSAGSSETMHVDVVELLHAGSSAPGTGPIPSPPSIATPKLPSRGGGR